MIATKIALTGPKKDLNPDRPKRILSLDGGGIRGIVAAEVLLAIETLILDQNKGWNCLADYFDLIGGNSTGALIAASLAKGLRVREILDLYKNFGREMFTPNWFLGRLRAKYNPGPLERKLQEVLGANTLFGSDEIKTFLTIVTKNTVTQTDWFFVNHPNNKNFDRNSSIPLWKIVRASSAAPTFFPPYSFQVDRKSYDFVDGAMSMYNNPAFRLFLEAVIEAYGINWEAKSERLLMISVGNGFSQEGIEPPGTVKEYNLIDWANYAVQTLMEDANVQQNQLMKIISKMPKPESVNREMIKAHLPLLTDLKSFKNKDLSTNNQGDESLELLTYHRYTTEFSKERFAELDLGDIDPKKVASIDCVDRIDALSAIGKAIAKEQVDLADFAGFLDR